ncbi:MAG: NAD-dependent epimerase/dehydratase family protein [Phycisphaerales bacterium]
MDLLILGGTAFLGPETVAAAKARGWKITLFNRGKTRADLFPDLEKVRGDRDPTKGEGLKGLEELIAKGRRWDAVIDNSGYRPQDVRASAELLKKVARQYVFISTVSVYASTDKPYPDEDAPVGTIEDPEKAQVSNMTYGPLKAACEKAAIAVFGDRCTVLRPGLIVGPGDPTDRFTYWPVRIAQGGRVLIPGPKDPWRAFVAFVDVRDLAEFAVRCIADGHGGTYNVLGPAGMLTFDEMVFGCKAVVSTPVEFVPVGEEFLLQNQVQPWMGLPLWIPQGDEPDGMGTASRKRAVAAGCTFRPLADTARDTIAWWKSKHPGAYDWGAKPGQPGLSLKREEELLQAWDAVRGAGAKPAAEAAPKSAPEAAPAAPAAAPKG